MKCKERVGCSEVRSKKQWKACIYITDLSLKPSSANSISRPIEGWTARCPPFIRRCAVLKHLFAPASRHTRLYIAWEIPRIGIFEVQGCIALSRCNPKPWIIKPPDNLPPTHGKAVKASVRQQPGLRDPIVCNMSGWRGLEWGTKTNGEHPAMEPMPFNFARKAYSIKYLFSELYDSCIIMWYWLGWAEVIMLTCQLVE